MSVIKYNLKIERETDSKPSGLNNMSWLQRQTGNLLNQSLNSLVDYTLDTPVREHRNEN